MIDRDPIIGSNTSMHPRHDVACRALRTRAPRLRTRTETNITQPRLGSSSGRTPVVLRSIAGSARSGTHGNKHNEATITTTSAHATNLQRPPSDRDRRARSCSGRPIHINGRRSAVGRAVLDHAVPRLLVPRVRTRSGPAQSSRQSLATGRARTGAERSPPRHRRPSSDAPPRPRRGSPHPAAGRHR